jgi:hypothetical protein
MRSLVLTSVAIALFAGAAAADEAKPRAPAQLALDFKIGENAYSVKISSTSASRMVAISCNGALVSKLRLDGSPHWKIAGSIIGAELSVDDARRCSGGLTLGLVTRDFSAPGDRTLSHYQLVIAGNEIATFGQSGLRQ